MGVGVGVAKVRMVSMRRRRRRRRRSCCRGEWRAVESMISWLRAREEMQWGSGSEARGDVYFVQRNGNLQYLSRCLGSEEVGGIGLSYERKRVVRSLPFVK